MTIDDLIAACAGVVDVSVDVAARDLDRVLERLRSLDRDAREKLLFAVARALANARTDLAEAELEVAKRDVEIGRWRANRGDALSKDPTLVPTVDARIAELEANRDLEVNEYRASLEQLEQAYALIVRASR